MLETLRLESQAEKEIPESARAARALALNSFEASRSVFWWRAGVFDDDGPWQLGVGRLRRRRVRRLAESVRALGAIYRAARRGEPLPAAPRGLEDVAADAAARGARVGEILGLTSQPRSDHGLDEQKEPAVEQVAENAAAPAPTQAKPSNHLKPVPGASAEAAAAAAAWHAEKHPIERQAVPNIHHALAEILAAVPSIGKGHTADDGSYRYRSIDDVYRIFHGLFAQHGVLVLPQILSHKAVEMDAARGGAAQLVHTVIMRYTFTSRDGTSVSCEFMGSAVCSSDKGPAKAQSSALRQLLLQMFLVPTGEDNDPDARVVKLASGSMREPREAGQPDPAPSNSAPPASTSAPGSPGGDARLPPVAETAKRLRDRLCAARSPEELEQFEEEMRGELAALKRDNKKTHGWLVQQVNTHKGKLNAAARQPPQQRRRG